MRNTVLSYRDVTDEPHPPRVRAGLAWSMRQNWACQSRVAILLVGSALSLGSVISVERMRRKSALHLLLDFTLNFHPNQYLSPKSGLFYLFLVSRQQFATDRLARFIFGSDIGRDDRVHDEMRFAFAEPSLMIRVRDWRSG